MFTSDDSRYMTRTMVRSMIQNAKSLMTGDRVIILSRFEIEVTRAHRRMEYWGWTKNGILTVYGEQEAGSGYDHDSARIRTIEWARFA